MSLSSRTFGVEIECIMPAYADRSTIAAAIRSAAGVSVKLAGYGAPTAICWKIQTDRSTGYQGCEVVSPVLSGEAGIAEVRRVADALRNAGCTVNGRTGLHVHFGSNGLDLKAMKNLTKMYVWFESFFDHIMPVSRRATNNQYIQSNRADFGGYGTDAVNLCFDRVDAATSLYGLVNTASPQRYRKLNLRNVTGGTGTIEFRQHSGTVEADKIENWVRLLDAFVTKALVTRIRKRKVARDLTPVEEMRQMLDMIEVEKPVRSFYMERRKAFAKAALTGIAFAA